MTPTLIEATLDEILAELKSRCKAGVVALGDTPGVETGTVNMSSLWGNDVLIGGLLQILQIRYATKLIKEEWED